MPIAEELLGLFAILALGSWLGQLAVRQISLGSAGVLFVALIFGHFGQRVPAQIMDLGLLLFVYAVGLQAGPRFFRSFRGQGVQFVVLGIVSVLTSVVATIVIARVLGLPFDLATGLFTGAVTNTPALAAATDVVSRLGSGEVGNLSAGYGIAYPYSMIGVVLLIQVLPRLLRRPAAQEEERWLHEQQQGAPALLARQFLITNPNVEGKLVSEVNPHRMSLANISRVRRGDNVFAATPDIKLRSGDIVMVVGPAAELDKMRMLLGQETSVPMDLNTSVLSSDVEVTETSLTGKRLAELRFWERFNVVITRIRREGIEITPTGSSTLEMGDVIRVVGEKPSVDEFVKLVHTGGRRADETTLVPFLMGLVLGILLGSISLPITPGFNIRLGTAGGAFVVSLLVGHFGGVGPLRLYAPPAAKNVLRELGLMLFLAGAGTNAGSHIVGIIQRQGWSLLLAGIFITTVTVLVALLLAVVVYRMNVLTAMGAICACMTNPPGLAAANAHSLRSDAPTLSYASVYPVALIFKIVLAQVLVEVLWRLQG